MSPPDGPVRPAGCSVAGGGLSSSDGSVVGQPSTAHAPGEGRDVIAEFKVDSVRLPHGAQLWRMDADGTETMIAILDSDKPAWRRVGEP